MYLITEVCEKLGVEKKFVIHCIREHWVRPNAAGEATLDDEDLARLRLISELQAVFGVNDEAIPVILHLVDQLYYAALRSSLSRSSGDSSAMGSASLREER